MMEQQKGKEVDAASTTSNDDLQVAQALIAEPTFKLDSAPSPYKVCVAISCFSESCGGIDCFSFHLAGRNGGMGCVLDVCCLQQTLPECTVPACQASSTTTKRRHTDDSVSRQRGNLGHPPRLLHGVQVPALVQLRKVSRMVVVGAEMGK